MMSIERNYLLAMIYECRDTEDNEKFKLTLEVEDNVVAESENPKRCRRLLMQFKEATLNRVRSCLLGREC